MSKFLYPIYKLKTKSYIKWWLYHKKAGGSGILSEILEGFSFNLENTLNRKFKLFEIEGNSVQDGTPSPIYSAGDNENLLNPELAEDKKYQNIDGNYSIATHPQTWISGLQSIESSQSYILNYQAQTGAFYDENRNVIKSSPIYRSNTFQTPSNAKYVNLTFTPSIVTFDDKDKVKLEQGTVATPYSPYGMGSINEKITNSDGTKEQDYSIFVQQPFRSNKDKTIRDKFVVKSDGKLYERHYKGRKIFDGTENWTLQQNCFTFSIDDIKPTPNYADRNQLIVISNFFIGQPSSYRGEVLDLRICKTIDAGNPKQIAIKDTSKTLAEFKTWLAEQYASGNPVYVDYLLAEPLDLPCTPEQIEALENLPSTYKDFTIIQSEDETPAHLKIQYYKEG